MNDRKSADTEVRVLTPEWQCKICTLINDNFSIYCDACSNPRDVNNTYHDMQKLVPSLINQRASQVTSSLL